MIKSYVTLALRALKKRPGYSFINVAGLGLGLACFALILLFVQDELSYDAHHEDADRIYRVGLIGYPPNSEPDRFAVTGGPVGRVLRSDFPEVESVVRINDFTATVTREGTNHYDQQFWFAEPELFDVFTIPLISGDPTDLLQAPRSMVLTESAASRIFGDRDPVGQTVTIRDTLNVSVVGVIADFPSTSHFTTDFILSWATRLETQPEDEGWLSLGLYTYVKLGNDVEAGAFEDKIRPLVDERFAESLAAMGFKVDLLLEPLRDIYLQSDLRAQIGPLGDMTQVWVFSAVALFILLLACINFTNLATARSMERAREVGVRKVAGSSRKALIGQFLSESVVLALFAFAIALVLMVVARPMLNSLAGKELSLASLFAPARLFALGAVAIASGLIGGLYPAVVLSGMKSVTVLKGSFHSSKKGAILRKGLVSLQFAISIGLLAGTAIVGNQLEFMRTQDLGFDQEQVLVVDTPVVPRQGRAAAMQTMKTEFGGLASVAGASISSTVPGQPMGRILFSAEGIADDDVRSARLARVGPSYFDNLGIPVLAGRAFSDEFPSDAASSIVISAETVEYLAWGTPEDALGKTVSIGGERTVIGVVGDYHHDSLKESIEPMIFITNPAISGFLALRLRPGDPRQAITEAETKWNQLYPGAPFEFVFLDDDYNRQYQAEERLARISSVFAALAIIIACLGLIGLAAFTAQQRTKEVGVRKALGASTTGLMGLLSREFAILVGVGFGLAIPLTTLGMRAWLSAFPYHVSVDPFSFLWAGGAALLMAVASVSYQAMRVALTNPVDSLRYE